MLVSIEYLRLTHCVLFYATYAIAAGSSDRDCWYMERQPSLHGVWPTPDLRQQ